MNRRNVLNKNTWRWLLEKIKLPAGVLSFIIVSAFLSALLQHYYAELIYNFTLFDNWENSRESVFYFFSIDIYIYAVGCALFYLTLALPLLKKIKLSQAGRKYLLMGILLIEIVIIFTMGGNFNELFTIRALIEIVIYILPALLINYFLWDRSILKSAVQKKQAKLISRVIAQH